MVSQSGEVTLETEGETRLFAYGTLLDPEVFRMVTGVEEDLPSEPCVLRHYRRVQVVGENYPGAVPDPEASIAGRLFTLPDAGLLARLDEYEGQEYERIRVEVELETNHAVVAAWFYLTRPEFRHRLAGVACGALKQLDRSNF